MKKSIVILTAILLSVSFAGAQTKVVPIVDMKVGGLLGGVQNGKYLNAAATVKTMSAEADYTLYLFDGSVERVLEVKKPKPFCPDGFYNLDFSDRTEGFFDKGGTALGTGYKWNPVPRKTSPVSLKSPAYQKIAADFLRTKGIAEPVVNLTQAVRVDLEGDGESEVLLTATRHVPYTEKDGKKTFDEYSVVLLRKIVGGKVRTIVLTGEFALKNRNEFDGNLSTVSSIVDLNGDGKMEIVIAQEKLEGGGGKVFEIVGNRAAEVKILAVENGGECY